jgi:hypothetical protein
MTTAVFKRFPVGGLGASPLMIPWALAEEAYAAYARRHGRSQSIERVAERGGFSPEEMDRLRPGWAGVVNSERERLEDALRKSRIDHGRDCLESNTGKSPWRCACAAETHNANIDAILADS